MADAPASQHVETAAAHAPAGDDDEWEYEYSTTETETHLITLDLSIPEFVHRDADVVVHNTRGGFRSWLNPINLEQGDAVATAATMAESKNHHDNGVADDEPAEIQILELHGEPIIAYRGMLFRGTWADTIGTEMLFADNNNNNKSESQGELVGAASARIACSPIELRDYSATARAETMKRARKRLGFVIPVANGATAQRQKQGAFLESLMALKHRRNEGDVVTVLAVDAKESTVRDAEGVAGVADEETAEEAVSAERTRQQQADRAKRPAVPNTDDGHQDSTEGVSPVRKRARPEDG